MKALGGKKPKPFFAYSQIFIIHNFKQTLIK